MTFFFFAVRGYESGYESRNFTTKIFDTAKIYNFSAIYLLFP